MNYQEYIKSELIVLIPVLNIIGLVLKKSKLPNKWIPIVLGIISIMLTFIWVISSCPVSSWIDFIKATFIAITQGILLAGASVYFNQIHHQLTRKDDSLNEFSSKNNET